MLLIRSLLQWPRILSICPDNLEEAPGSQEGMMRKVLLVSSVSCLGFLAAPAAIAQQTQPAEPSQEEAEPSQEEAQPAEEGAEAEAAEVGPGTQDLPAAAQPETGIQDIVVTAQRRQEPAQDVPIAISAFSAEQLQAQGVTNTLELGRFVPNLVAMNNTGIGSANAYYLRGLGSTETIATFDPPVGTYVDDIYLSRQNANNLSLFDVERVEVMRGPQGTLFGRNTTGGAINVIMRQPGRDFGGFVEAGFGRFNKYTGRASVDLPVMDNFAVKLSGYFQDDRGYARNITTGERLNDDDGWGGRIGVRADLTDTVRWVGSFMHVDARGENILNFECNPADPSDCDGRFITTGLSERDGPPSPYAPLVISGRKANYGLGQEAVSDIFTSNLQWEIADRTTLNLITGYVDLTQQFALDFFDGRGGPSIAVPFPPVRGFPRGGFTILNDGSHEQFTQEIKINGELAGEFIEYVAGFFYINEKNRTDFADIFTIFSPAVPGGIPLLLADRVLRNKTEAYAGYAQADFHVTQTVTLTAGIRYTDETKTFRIRDNRPACNDGTLEPTCLDNQNLVAISGVPIPTKQNAKLWTPRFAVNYEPNENLLLFASATRGFKSGGWNARGTAPNQLLPFDPETVWSYELGVKSDWLDRRLRANVTFFHLDVSELQTISGLVNPATGAITFLTRNFADYRNTGVEAEFQAIPVTGLNVYANIGYQDDKYIVPRGGPEFDEFGIQSIEAQQAACRAALAAGLIPGGPGTAACVAGIVTATGDIATPVRTPKWSLALGANYDLPLGGTGWRLVPAVNATYRSLQEVQTSNLTIYTGSITGANGTFPANPFDGDIITGSRTPAHWIFNSSLALNSPDDRMQFVVECTNCFDETYFQSALANYSYINPPMTWMVRGRYRF
jgi:iron complex outermembrane receptor protein